MTHEITKSTMADEKGSPTEIPTSEVPTSDTEDFVEEDPPNTCTSPKRPKIIKADAIDESETHRDEHEVMSRIRTLYATNNPGKNFNEVVQRYKTKYGQRGLHALCLALESKYSGCLPKAHAVRL